MTVRPMVLAVRFGPKNVDATRFAADEWTRGDVSMQGDGSLPPLPDWIECDYRRARDFPPTPECP